jgi:integrase
MSTAGSVKKDESGQWTFSVDVPGEGGRRRQLHRRGFATKRAASDALTEVLASVAHGTFVRPARTTVATYIDEWLSTLPSTGRRPSTVQGYNRLLRTHLLPDLGHVELQSLTALALDRLYARLLTTGRRHAEGGLSTRTVRYLHTVTGKALADAERKGLVQRNVARLASPPSSSSARAPEMSAWTPGEMSAFLEAAAGHHHGALFRVAGMTGLRRGELCGLRWADLDLEAGTVAVRRTITATPTGLVVGDVKTSRSRRVVDVDTATTAVLRRHLATQLEQRLLVGGGYTDQGYIFAMVDGSPWNPDTISQAFTRIVGASTLPRIRFHDLRHSHASHLLAAGVNVKVVSERLGHASVAFTLDTYAHVMPGQQAGAAAAVAALVDGR